MTRSRQQRRARGAGPSDTRDRLVAAAKASVARNGVQGATSRDITDRAEANLAAITYHFGSKDALITEALFDEVRRRIEPAAQLLNDDTDPTAAMLAAVEYLTTEFEHAKEQAPVYLAALLEASRPGLAATAARQLLGDVANRLSERMTDLQQLDVVPDWVDPDAMAALIIAVANGVALHASITPDGIDATRVAGQFAALLTAAQRDHRR